MLVVAHVGFWWALACASFWWASGKLLLAFCWCGLWWALGGLWMGFGWAFILFVSSGGLFVSFSSAFFFPALLCSLSPPWRA